MLLVELALTPVLWGLCTLHAMHTAVLGFRGEASCSPGGRQCKKGQRCSGWLMPALTLSVR